MKILVISQYYYPEPFRVTDICEELVYRGHSVTVITALPNYPEGEIYPEYKNRNKIDEYINGVHILRCKSRPRHKGNLNLGLSYLSFTVMAFLYVSNIADDFDLVYVYQMSPVLMGLPAIKYGRKYKKPVYLYCCDLWPESIRDVFKSKNSIFYRIIHYVSKYVYQNVDFIAVKSPSFIKNLESVCKIERSKLHYLPEHAENTYLFIDTVPYDNQIVDFMFLGNLGKSQDCDIIVKATNLINPQLPFMVHFVGSGSAMDNLQQIAKEYNLDDRIIFHGRHPLEEMPSFYQFADVCLLTLSNLSSIGLTIPAKLPSYLAAARPVVAAISGDGATMINDAGCGYCVEAGDFVGLAAIMTKCIESRDTLIEMGKRGRDYFVQHLSKKVVINELESMLINVCDNWKGNK